MFQKRKFNYLIKVLCLFNLIIVVFGYRIHSQTMRISPISIVEMFERSIFVKRDDLLMCGLECLSGNKGRKFKPLITSSGIFGENVVSYGGAQSNAMLALARISSAQGTKFTYITKKIPQTLREKPIGNYRTALEVGMKVRPIYIKSRTILKNDKNQSTIFFLVTHPRLLKWTMQFIKEL
jgi:1-aminocyclopropane-1-carboxylate deaminase/D-cysteine desulfhydrase-like pyridoxal-dependent ACC family enzyme